MSRNKRSSARGYNAKEHQNEFAPPVFPAILALLTDENGTVTAVREAIYSAGGKLLELSVKPAEPDKTYAENLSREFNGSLVGKEIFTFIAELNGRYILSRPDGRMLDATESGTMLHDGTVHNKHPVCPREVSPRISGQASDVRVYTQRRSVKQGIKTYYYYSDSYTDSDLCGKPMQSFDNTELDELAVTRALAIFAARLGIDPRVGRNRPAKDDLAVWINSVKESIAELMQADKANEAEVEEADRAEPNEPIYSEPIKNEPHTVEYEAQLLKLPSSEEDDEPLSPVEALTDSEPNPLNLMIPQNCIDVTDDAFFDRLYAEALSNTDKRKPSEIFNELDYAAASAQKREEDIKMRDALKKMRLLGDNSKGSRYDISIEIINLMEDAGYIHKKSANPYSVTYTVEEPAGEFDPTDADGNKIVLTGNIDYEAVRREIHSGLLSAASRKPAKKFSDDSFETASRYVELWQTFIGWASIGETPDCSYWIAAPKNWPAQRLNAELNAQRFMAFEYGGINSGEDTGSIVPLISALHLCELYTARMKPDTSSRLPISAFGAYCAADYTVVQLGQPAAAVMELPALLALYEYRYSCSKPTIILSGMPFAEYEQKLPDEFKAWFRQGLLKLMPEGEGIEPCDIEYLDFMSRDISYVKRFSRHPKWSEYDESRRAAAGKITIENSRRGRRRASSQTTLRYISG